MFDQRQLLSLHNVCKHTFLGIPLQMKNVFVMLCPWAEDERPSQPAWAMGMMLTVLTPYP